MKRYLICFTAVILLGISFTAPALAEFPERPITIIVAMDAGGPTDVLTRTLAVGMEKYLGTPVIVENRGGGGGAVALGVLQNAKPDGYTLVTCQNVSIVDTPLMQKVTYKPLKSFTPLVVFSHSEHTALLVKSDAPWKTFAEFIAFAKANPGKIKYSSAGVGSGMHVAMEYIAYKDGIKWVHVPYKGTAPSRMALLGGHVDACSSGIDWPPFVQSGQLRVLATHGNTRSPYAPDVPTLKELGYGYVSEAYQTAVAPAGLPAEVTRKLEIAFKKATESKEFKGAVEKLYATPLFMDSKAYERHLKEKWERTEKDFKRLGIIKEAATQPY